MLIELTEREVELLLILIDDATGGDFSLDGGCIVTQEEEKLIEKLKKAVEKSEKSKTGKKDG